MPDEILMIILGHAIPEVVNFIVARPYRSNPRLMAKQDVYRPPLVEDILLVSKRIGGLANPLINARRHDLHIRHMGPAHRAMYQETMSHPAAIWGLVDGCRNYEGVCHGVNLRNRNEGIMSGRAHLLDLPPPTASRTVRQGRNGTASRAVPVRSRSTWFIDDASSPVMLEVRGAGSSR